MKHVYLSGTDIAKQLSFFSKSYRGSHQIITADDTQILIPQKTDSETINPQNISQLKKEFNISQITIIDRVKSTESAVVASGQINRSGTSFLRGKTPYKNQETFPDVSGALMGTPRKKQITIGGKRFNDIEKNNSIDYFEWMAPISTVWHYMNVKIIGAGIGPRETTAIPFF